VARLPYATGAKSPKVRDMYVSGSEPYPWPYDGELDASRLVLIAAGMQNHWLDRSTGQAKAVQRAIELADLVQRAGGAIVAIRYGTAINGAGRQRVPAVGSAGWAVQLDGVDTDLVIDSSGLDAFYDTPLDGALRARHLDRLVFVGAASELTVDSTLRGANDRGYECLVVRDACAAVDPAIHERALDSVTMSGGIFGAIAYADAVADTLTQLASSQETS
jgi:nicotinamidase-related amidase